MNFRLSSLLAAMGGLGMLGSLATAQNATPAPLPPPKVVKDKAAAEAAAIQSPKIILPPGGEGSAKILVPATKPEGASQKLPDVRSVSPKPPATLKLNPPPATTKPAASSLPPVIGGPSSSSAPGPAAPSITPPPPLPPAPSPTMTKEQALEQVTKENKMGIEAPRIPTPSDKIPVVSSTSASGQFRVHGNDLSLRSRMSSHLDEISKELRDALKDVEGHVIPVNVRLSQGEEAVKATSAGAPPVGVQITEVEGGGFHLQLDIRDVPALKLADIRRETLRILLAERILRGHSTATPPKERLLLPDWVFTGTLQTLDFRAAERPATLFAAIFKSGKIYGIEEIIEASPMEMDSLSRAIYETSCGALVMALIEQPDGGRRFNKFLNSLAVDPRPERELLNEAFPGFAASASSLNKWWSLQLASLAKRRVADPLTADETMRALEQAITIRYVAKTNEVPKDIKKRPFETPASLFLAPPPKPKPSPATLEEPTSAVAERSGDKKSPSKSTSKSKAAEDAEAAEEDEDASISKKEGSPWLRYLTLGLMGSKKGEEDSDDEEKPANKAGMSKAKEGEKEDEATTKAVSKNNRYWSNWTSIYTPSENEPKDESKSESKGGSKAGESKEREREKEREAQKTVQVKEKQVVEAKSPVASSNEKVMEEADKPAKAKPTADTKNERYWSNWTSVPPAKEASEAKSKTEPKAGAKGESKSAPKEEKPMERGSLVNPLNWFRSGKKAAEEDKEAKKDDKPASEGNSQKSQDNEEKKKSAFWMEWAPSPISLVNWHVGPLVELWSHFGAKWPRQAFLDFLKRKKPEESDSKEKDKAKKTAEPEKPQPAPAASKKKADSKPQDKTPPKTTNPNAKPAAKPVQPADGSPRTTNPAAKPVPIPKAPPPTATADDDLPELPPGSQWVEIHLEDYKHILQHPDRVKILEKNAQALRALQPQASVLMRPVVNGYLGIVMDLQEGKTKDLDKRLKDLRSYVTLTAQQTKAVRDYIDYYEANDTEQLSGAFDDFLDLPNIIQRELPAREDPIARYLDAIDKEFNK